MLLRMRRPACSKHVPMRTYPSCCACKQLSLRVYLLHIAEYPKLYWLRSPMRVPVRVRVRGKQMSSFATSTCS